MHNVRIIARLDIKGPNLVKGIHLEGLRVLGKPEEFARYYYENGADELFYQDVVASLYGRNSLIEIIEKTAADIFIPLTVGGGLRSLEDIKKVLRAGADKVCINTAAIQNPELITQAANKFGSSTIVVAIEAIKQIDGKYLCFTDNGREHTGKDVVEWALEVEKRGAGEILLTSVDKEGTGSGYDLDFIQSISDLVSIPVIVHGGGGKLDHLSEVIEETDIDAIAIASMLHYDFITKNEVNMDGISEGNTDFLKNSRKFTKIEASDIQTIKKYLVNQKIPCRI